MKIGQTIQVVLLLAATESGKGAHFVLANFRGQATIRKRFQVLLNVATDDSTKPVWQAWLVFARLYLASKSHNDFFANQLTFVCGPLIACSRALCPSPAILLWISVNVVVFVFVARKNKQIRQAHGIATYPAVGADRWHSFCVSRARQARPLSNLYKYKCIKCPCSTGSVAYFSHTHTCSCLVNKSIVFNLCLFALLLSL